MANDDAATKPERCPECGTLRVEKSKFCEVCRHDYTTAPVPTLAVPATPEASLPEEDAVIHNLWALVTADASLSPSAVAEISASFNEPMRSYPIDLDELLVGRKFARPNIHPEVPVNDPAVSARHLKICRRRGGGFYLVDLDSKNGTRLNGVELMPNVETPVKPGDEIVIGQWTRIKLEAR